MNKTIINNWTGGGTLQTWTDGEWQILYAKDSAGNCVTLSLPSSDAVRLAYAVSPVPSEQHERLRAANEAVYELSYPGARADELRQIAEEIDCGGGCEECSQQKLDRGEFCGFVSAENLRKLASALDLKAKVDASRPDAGGGVRVPHGYALVPAKPTPAMIEAGCEQNPTQWNEGTDLGFAADVANDVYVAMVRAAAISTPSDAVNESAEQPQWPANLHPLTLDLVKRFAVALAEKLCLAEEKYGYSDNWQRDDWKDDCQHKLIKHIAKGDPRDVATYCAFMWHHGWPTVILDSDELAGCRAVLREATVKNAKQAAMIADLNDMVLRYAHRAETNESAPQPGNSYYTIQSALSPHIASSTELMAAMSSIWPLIKLPSVVNESAEAEEDETYEIGLRDGYEDAIQDLDIATGGDGEFKGSTIPGETVDVPVMKQRIIDRFASDESAEARLREALIALDERLRSCGGLHTAEDAYDSFYQDIVSEALSPSGDEAKKSEGGEPDVERTQRRLAVSDDGLGPMQVIPRETPSVPSDPSDRREIVARIKADPGDGTVSPDLAHVLARGFEAMGWQRPQNAAEDMIVALLAALEEVHDAR